MAAALAVYQACFVKHQLARGEVGYVLVLAASQAQARIVFDYVRGFLSASPVLKQEIDSTTATEIRLQAASSLRHMRIRFRSIRGRTLLACIFDEAAMWRDEVSAIPDLEVYRAVLPALMTTKGMLIGISTPYRKLGLLYQKHRDHFGQDGDDILVVQGASTRFNPNLTQSAIDAAIADDPEAARAEWEAEFRSDLTAFLDEATIEAAVDHSRPLELPPMEVVRQYSAFVDPSGGRHDAFAICIGHNLAGPSNMFVADVIRAVRPPFDPQAVVADYAALLKEYRVTTVVGDNFSGSGLWRRSGSTEFATSWQRRQSRYCTSRPCRCSCVGRSRSRIILR